MMFVNAAVEVVNRGGIPVDASYTKWGIAITILSILAYLIGLASGYGIKMLKEKE